ncbi:MAG TPA: TerB family tellurite resistance protein [bacterium]|nr:TerB family tellurite resistance protein [bacterium]
MRRFLEKILGDLQASPDTDPEMPDMPNRAIALAVSVILLEIATMDNDLADIEIETITGILREYYKLQDDEISRLLENADAVRRGAVDIFQFTRTINERCSRSEKRKLMEDIWRVIFADGKLDQYEDHFAHKLTRLLRLDHRDMIAAKMKARKGG